MKLRDEIYEPVHEEGQTCWCKPITTVDPVSKKVYIDHNQQRDVVPAIILHALENVEEHASQQDDNEEISGMLQAVEIIKHNLGLTN